MRMLANYKAILIVLIILDLVFIQLHRLSGQGILSTAFALENELGMPEFYQHLKQLAAVLIGFALFIRNRERLYLFWTVFFAYLLIDDSFEIHENLGAVFAYHFNNMKLFGIPAQALGELFFLMTVGALLFSLAVHCYLVSRKEARRQTRILAGMLVALAAFGVAVDVLHSILADKPGSHRLGIIEDGGELLVMSVMLWYLVKIFFAAPAISDLKKFEYVEATVNIPKVAKIL